MCHIAQKPTPQRRFFFILSLGVLAMLIPAMLSACRRSLPASQAPTATTSLASLPDREANVVLEPSEGGVVALSGGAELSLPPDAVTDKSIVNFRVVTDAPASPVPRSILGQAYEFSLEGGTLAGIAMLTLPLPVDVSADQYELAPYRWSGRTWERMAGRIVGQSVRFGSDKPGIVALLGQWRMAEATITLTMPTHDAGEPTVPMQVDGQYRYSAPPTVKHDYTEAHLELKQDSSGGAGQIAGDQTLDRTVAETVLWFKPDPGQSQGVINFSHTFAVAPETLDVPLGSVVRFYAVLTVVDSSAPTRRLSTGTEYVQMLPIQVLGTDVVRPTLTDQTAQTLRWRVQLNGQMLFERPATEAHLSLAEVLAQGGLGEYRIVLEAESDGRYVPVSNEVTVQLALPTTPTAAPPPEPTSVPVETPMPEETVSPFGTMPPTPTRRSPSGDNLTPTPTPTGAEDTPTPTLTPSPTRPSWANVFWADTYTLGTGDCTTLHWDVENVAEVFFGDTPTTGTNEQRVCPSSTTTYTLRVVDLAGTAKQHRLTVLVTSGVESNIEFIADDYQLPADQCTTLSWQVTGALEVYLKLGDEDETGQNGIGSTQVCPSVTTTYQLRVVKSSGTVTKQITITVYAADAIFVRFWADQYTMAPSGCTSLHWSVQNVKEVWLREGSNDEQPVAGVSSRDNVCPPGVQNYTLRVVGADDSVVTRTISLLAGDPELEINEAVAQGIVRSVTHVDDLDSSVSGNQSGWRILVDGVNRLFPSGGSCCESTVTLEVPQTQASNADPAMFDWPISPNQLIEFRGTCTSNTCKFIDVPPQYLKLESN